jgi:NDP-sugar pyrophosphorylase family protein
MMPLAILAGGLGSRLAEYTVNRPKSLIPVAGTPFIWHQLALLRAAGIQQVFVLGSHLIEQIEEELEYASSPGFEVQVWRDDPPLCGTARALQPVARHLHQPFFVLYGDSFLNCDYGWIEERFRRSGAPAMMVVCKPPSGAKPNADCQRGFILRYNKRRVSVSMQHIDYGLNVMSPDALRDYTLVSDLADVQESLARRGRLAGLIWPERYYSIGSSDGLRETEAVILSRMSHGSG